jgi:uncharacterized protein
MRGSSQAASQRSKSAPHINPAFARYTLRVARSRIQGQGVFAQERIPARRRVIEYTGEKISTKEGTRRLLRLWRPGGSRRVVIFCLNRRWCVDANVGGSGAEMINHSCAPNLETRKAGGHIYYYSRRAIRPGEELTVDYRFDPEAIRVPCKCGAPACRGTINLKPRPKGRRARRG